MSDLPEGWTERHLSSLGVEVKGTTTLEPGTTYELYSVPAFADGLPEVVDGGDVKSGKRPVQPGDLLVCKINPRINRVWIVGEPRDSRNQVASTEYLVLRMPENEPAFTRRFVMWYLRSPRFRSWIKLNVEGATGSHTRAKSPAVLRQEVPMAPPDEQQRIVEAIEEQFSRIEAGAQSLRRARRNLVRLRAVVLSEAVRGRLVNQESESASVGETVEDLLNGDFATSDPPALSPWEIPGNWAWTTIGQIFQVFVGSTPSRSDDANWGGDVPWVSSGEVAFNRIRSTKENITRDALGNPDRRLHPPGTVMLGMIGEGKTRGQAAILDIWAAHNQNCASIRVSETPILPEWVYWYLVSRYEQTRRVGSGNNQPALNKTRVQQLPICIPPIAEQARIARELEREFTLLDAVEGALDAASNRADGLRRSTLRDAFSGRLVTMGSVVEVAGA